ncbi:MAG: TonB-dependent receptor, partial [Phenylobacterium sp.]
MTRVMGKRALACGAAVLALSVASAAFAQQRTFNLPANEAVKAIPEFARQAGLQIVAPADELKGVRTPAIRGQQDARTALKTLLAGTGLVVVADQGSVITLRRAGSAGPQASGAQAVAPEPSVVEAVVVTGTNIQGVAPAGQKLVAIDRREIDRSGYGNAQELLRSLPQNFGGVATESSFASVGGHQGDSVATARQSAINLRGLGAESTLILVDGRRMVAAGGKGVIADVSTIPLSAVERIEILPDGASALYGSDAVGGVVNFILKRNFEGAETRLRYGGVTSGGQREAQA